MNIERKYAIEIVELFEKLLEEKNIIVPSDDREGEEEEASLYGTEYYSLEDSITELLEKYKAELKDETVL